jgi:hypothetical protein
MHGPWANLHILGQPNTFLENILSRPISVQIRAAMREWVPPAPAPPPEGAISPVDVKVIQAPLSIFHK